MHDIDKPVRERKAISNIAIGVSLLIDLPDAVSERRHSDEKTEEPD
jgi:hypothetical protein